MQPSIAGFEYSEQPVPLLDLARENREIRDQVLAKLAEVFDSGRFLHGPDVSEVEATVAQLSGVPHAVGCASGSDAVLLSLMAAGIGPGDEVILPSFTFFATASAVARLGANIVFVDIDPLTFNLDPDHVAAAVTSRTKAIIPVHLFGQCAAMDRICEIAARHSLAVLEDAAQAIGASYAGRPAGSWGHAGCISFYPTKNLSGCGDGGMLTAQTAEWADRLRLLAAHGMNPRYFHKVIGINSRLDSMQAAALSVKLLHLERRNELRRANAARYAELFAEIGLDQVLQLPVETKGCHHVWNQYTIRVPTGRRDALRASLTAAGVGSEIYYPLPLHRQDCFADVPCRAGSLPETELAAAEVLSLPIFPELTADEQRTVVGRTAEFFRAGARQVA